MKRTPLEIMLLAIVACVSTVARTPAISADTASNGKVTAATPDLRISEFVFPAENEKAVRVHIVNAGGAASGLCVLRLTVRKINGISVGRVMEIKLPPLGPGKNKWLVVNATSILPNNIALEATTFKLNADATSIVAESDEANNEVWHNL
jgi:hypothetical protein